MEEMKRDEQTRDLYFSGDIHGDIRTLVWKLTQEYRIEDANVVILGDIGFGGFCKKRYYDNIYKRVHNKLEKNNICLYGIAGNHDERSWFTTENNYPRFKFLQDHEVVNLSGQSIYSIYGATSTDNEWREKYNKKSEKYGSSKRVWWNDEDVVKKYKDLPNRVDIIISHCAPISFEPIATRFSGESLETYERDLENRRYLDYVFQNVRHNYWYYGHYHDSITGSLEGTIYKCLDIMEIYQFINPKDYE